jgi:hypothetical protein
VAYPPGTEWPSYTHRHWVYLSFQVQVRVMLRPTVSWAVRLCVGHPVGPIIDDYFLSSSCRFSTVRVRVRVTLQLTVSQSVCLGVEPNLGLLTRDFFFLNLLSCHLGAPSLTRGRVCPLSVFCQYSLK